MCASVSPLFPFNELMLPSNSKFKKKILKAFPAHHFWSGAKLKNEKKMSKKKTVKKPIIHLNDKLSVVDFFFLFLSGANVPVSTNYALTTSNNSFFFFAFLPLLSALFYLLYKIPF